MDTLIGSVLVAIVSHFFVEAGPRQLAVLRDHDFFELLLAQGTMLVVHQKSDSKAALGAHRSVAALPHCEKDDIVKAEDATFFVGSGDLLLAHFAINSGSRLNHFVLTFSII